MVLTGIQPYLHAPRDRHLDVAVVGLGTGLTSGAASLCADVRSVTTIEISPGVIEAARFASDAAFGLFDNPSASIAPTDAFRFFARTRQKFDIIISEPSNVWVVGVENLFTPEYYQLVKRALADDGVLFQWFQIYEMDAEIVGAIALNVLDAFPYAMLMSVGTGDVGILASRQPITRGHVERRMAEAGVRQALAPIGFNDPALLSMMTIYPSQHLATMAYGEARRRHSVETPWIGPAAGRFRFLRTTARFGGPVMDDIGRHIPVPAERLADFQAFMQRHADELGFWCNADETRFAANAVCARVQPLAEQQRLLRQPMTLANMESQITAYGALREQGYIEADLGMLARAAEIIRHAATQAGVDAG
jgi:hypothetical protein